MDVDELLQRIVRRHGALLILFVVSAAVIAALLRFATPAEYSATARVLLRPDPPKSVAEAQAAADDATALVTSDSFLINALDAAQQRSNVAGRKLVHVTVSPLGSSGVAEISATYPTARVPALIANSLAHQYIDLQAAIARQSVDSVLAGMAGQISGLNQQIRAIEQRLQTIPAGPRADVLRDQHQALMNQRANLAVQRDQVAATSALAKIPVLVDSAVDPLSANPSHWAQDAALAALLGLVVGLVVATIFEVTSPSLVGRRAVARALGIPILGHMPGAPWADGVFDTAEMQEIAASAWLLAESENVDVLELLAVGDVPNIGQVADRLNELVGQLQPKADGNDAGSHYRPAHYRPPLYRLSERLVVEKPEPVRRLSIRVFGDTPLTDHPAPVVLTTSTTVSVRQVDRARDLARIGHRAVVAAITFRPSASISRHRVRKVQPALRTPAHAEMRVSSVRGG